MIYMISCFPYVKGDAYSWFHVPFKLLNAENWHTGQFSDSNFDSFGTATLSSTSGP
jgi:hypothetical protein